MLTILNSLQPFFEDTTAQLHVRSYAKLQHLSPPTASKVLRSLEKENLLVKQAIGIYHFYRAKKSSLFIALARIYWQERLKAHLKLLHKQVLFAPITIFGSTIKAENDVHSDIDIFMETIPPETFTRSLEQSLRRPVQVHTSMRSKQLASAIAEGVVIDGLE